MNSSSLAIDYQQLLREEKQKAKSRRRKQQQHQQQGQGQKQKHEGHEDGIEGKDPKNAQGSQTCNIKEKEDHLSLQPAVPKWPIEDHPFNLALSNSSTLNNNHKIPISRVLYHENAISKQEHSLLWDWCLGLASTTTGVQSWKSMKYGKRRVAMFEGEQQQQQQQQEDECCGLPRPLSDIANALVSHNIFPSSHPPNHVLINHYYEAGQGIVPHTDGPMYYDCTATISLERCILEQDDTMNPTTTSFRQENKHGVVFRFTRRLKSHEIGATSATSTKTITPKEDSYSILLEPRSLIVFQGDAYTKYCHGIDDSVLEEVFYDEHSTSSVQAPVTVVRGERISLTFRHKY